MAGCRATIGRKQMECYPPTNQSLRAFRPTDFPHIAAQQTSTEIDLSVIHQSYLELASRPRSSLSKASADFWRRSISIKRVRSAKTLDLPVILVVGMRLGCFESCVTDGPSYTGRRSDIGGMGSELHGPADVGVDGKYCDAGTTTGLSVARWCRLRMTWMRKRC